MTTKQQAMFQTQDLPIFSSVAPQNGDQAYIPTPLRQPPLVVVPGTLNTDNRKITIHNVKDMHALPMYTDFIEYRATVERAIKLFTYRYGTPFEVWSVSDIRHFIR